MKSFLKNNEMGKMISNKFPRWISIYFQKLEWNFVRKCITKDSKWNFIAKPVRELLEGFDKMMNIKKALTRLGETNARVPKARKIYVTLKDFAQQSFQNSQIFKVFKVHFF